MGWEFFWAENCLHFPWHELKVYCPISIWINKTVFFCVVAIRSDLFNIKIFFIRDNLVAKRFRFTSPKRVEKSFLPPGFLPAFYVVVGLFCKTKSCFEFVSSFLCVLLLVNCRQLNRMRTARTRIASNQTMYALDRPLLFYSQVTIRKHMSNCKLRTNMKN